MRLAGVRTGDKALTPAIVKTSRLPLPHRRPLGAQLENECACARCLGSSRPIQGERHSAQRMSTLAALASGMESRAHHALSRRVSPRAGHRAPGRSTKRLGERAKRPWKFRATCQKEQRAPSVQSDAPPEARGARERSRQGQRTNFDPVAREATHQDSTSGNDPRRVAASRGRAVHKARVLQEEAETTHDRTGNMYQCKFSKKSRGGKGEAARARPEKREGGAARARRIRKRHTPRRERAPTRECVLGSRRGRGQGTPGWGTALGPCSVLGLLAARLRRRHVAAVFLARWGHSCQGISHRHQPSASSVMGAQLSGHQRLPDFHSNLLRICLLSTVVFESPRSLQ